MCGLLQAAQGLNAAARSQGFPVSRPQGPRSCVLAAPSAPLRAAALWTAAGRRTTAAGVIAAAARRRPQGTTALAAEQAPELQTVLAPAAAKAAKNSHHARVHELAKIFDCPLEIAQEVAELGPRILQKRPENIAADVAEMRKVLAGSSNPTWVEWGAAPITTPAQLIERARVSPQGVERLKTLKELGIDVAVPYPASVLRWTRDSWEERLGIISLYGGKKGSKPKEEIRQLVEGDPEAWNQRLSKHKAFVELLKKWLDLPNRAAAVEIILLRPPMVTYPLKLVEPRLQQIVKRAGSKAAALEVIKSNPELIYRGTEPPAAEKPQKPKVPTTPKPARPRTNPGPGPLTNAAVLGVPEARLRKALGNTTTGLHTLPPALLEERLQGLMRIFKCTREVAVEGVLMQPSIGMTETAVIAEKVKAIKAAVARSKNPAWRTFVKTPITSPSGLRTWAAHSMKKIERLNYLVESGQDAAAVSVPLIVMPAAKFDQMYGLQF